MGKLTIETTPKTNAVYGGYVNSDRYPGLKRYEGPSNGQAAGGRFVLPPEFDTNEWASKFAPEGNEVLSLAQDEYITGTGYTAPGWKPWKYPDISSTPAYDEKTGEIKKDKDGVPIYEKHPKAGQLHKVSPIEKDGQTLVLLCRPLAIQKQVNELYGEVSRERMILENAGGTIAGEQNTDSGMLPEERLRKSLGVDPEVEDGVHASSAVLHSSIVPDTRGGRVSRREMRVTR